MSKNIIFIVDGSSSVNNYYEPYNETINYIIQTHGKTEPNGLLTLVTFDDYIRYICVNCPFRDIHEPFVLKPGGSTALYDCVCAIINKAIKFNNVIHARNPPITIILTDGEDTSSRILDMKQTALQIALAKARGWKFIFLGTSQNSLDLGRKIGCNVCILYSPTQKSFNSAGQLVCNILQTGVVENVNIDVSDLEKFMDKMSLE